MIGHSSVQGFLVLGDWRIDDTPQTAASFSLLLRPLFECLGVRVVRLLGCSTANTTAGRNAILRIARTTGCRVLGTKRYITRHDYEARGFVSEDALLAP